MSALNVVKQRDRVVLVTDAAAFDMKTGVIQGFPTKQVAIPSWPGVFATRGNPLGTPLFAHFLSCRFQTFDAMVAGIEDALPDVHRQVGAMCQGADEPLVLGGWSRDRNRPEGYMMSMAENACGANLEETAEAIQPPLYKLHALGTLTISPYVAREAYSGISGACQDMDELLRHMIALMEAQRRNFYKSKGSEPFCGIGGYAVAAIVSADGIRQKVFHRWPGDRVGKRIAPQVAFSSDLANLSIVDKSKPGAAVSDIISGPGSNLFAGATGETNMLPSDVFSAASEAADVAATTPEGSEPISLDPGVTVTPGEDKAVDVAAPEEEGGAKNLGNLGLGDQQQQDQTDQAKVQSESLGELQIPSAEEEGQPKGWADYLGNLLIPSAEARGLKSGEVPYQGPAERGDRFANSWANNPGAQWGTSNNTRFP
jgi:hypothetical protein